MDLRANARFKNLAEKLQVMIFKINAFPLSRFNKVYICCFGKLDSGYCRSFGRSRSLGRIGSYPWNDIIFEGYP